MKVLAREAEGLKLQALLLMSVVLPMAQEKAEWEKPRAVLAEVKSLVEGRLPPFQKELLSESQGKGKFREKAQAKILVKVIRVKGWGSGELLE